MTIICQKRKINVSYKKETEFIIIIQQLKVQSEFIKKEENVILFLLNVYM